MSVSIKVPRPVGEFSITVNGNETSSNNLFTSGGIHSIYKSGKNVVIDPSGGLFSFCKIGNGAGRLSESSDGLSGHIPMTSALVSTALEYYTDSGQQFAKGVFVYTFAGEYIGDITEIMLTSSNSNSGMICGRTLETPIPITRGDDIRITYCVTIPIFNNVMLMTGTADDEVYYLECSLFESTPTTLTSLFPVETPIVTTGNLPRMFDEGVELPLGETRLSCITATTPTTISYRLDVGILASTADTYIKEIKFGNCVDAPPTINNLPFTFRYGTRVLKPSGIDWGIDFTLELEFPNVYHD